jgi:hypothetical protein
MCWCCSSSLGRGRWWHGNWWASAFGQDDVGNEDKEGDSQRSNGLVFNAFQLVFRDLSIPEVYNDWCKAQEILSVDSYANADARDIWVGRNGSYVGRHGGKK